MSVYLDDGDVTLHHGDAAAVLATLPEASVDCVVTSPPYFGLRDYGYDGQIGLEPTPAEFIARLVDVFEQIRRVLIPTGTCWVNMGDSYANDAKWGGSSGGKHVSALHGNSGIGRQKVATGAKPKDLLGMPWRLAFALQDAGWWLRSDVIWAKPDPMPESVTDRPTKAHEYLFLLTKASRYYWDAEGVREPPTWALPTGTKTGHDRGGWVGGGANDGRTRISTPGGVGCPEGGRNVRTVWTFPTEPNPEAHFATFPRELVRRCLAAGCPERVCATCGVPSVRVVERQIQTDPGRGEGSKLRDAEGLSGVAARTAKRQLGGAYQAQLDALPRTSTWTDCGHGAYRPGVVLDPFIGSGTTAVVARAMGRRCVGIDGSAEYLEIARKRTQQLSLLGGAA